MYVCVCMCVCVCVHHVSVATVLLQLLWLLLVACSSPLQATNTERKEQFNHMPLLPVKQQHTYLRT